jgi:uncharacterized membrane protein YGL010W
MIRLDPEWARLMRSYEAQHMDPRNRRCHRVGISLLVASAPVAATVVGLPLAAAMLTVGCGFQALGHYFEGKKPAFLEDRRNVIVGLLWWLKECGVRVELGSA